MIPIYINSIQLPKLTYLISMPVAGSKTENRIVFTKTIGFIMISTHQQNTMASLATDLARLSK